jgi:parallel beta-helix repeat protein
VDAASPGDTIIVRDGTYTENVKVNKDHLTIKSDNGAEKTIVQAANPDDHVFEVTGDYVSITGLTMIGGGKGGAVISVINSSYTEIENNICRHEQLIYQSGGITLLNSPNSSVRGNTVYSAEEEAIQLQNCPNSVIKDNTCSGADDAIELWNSSNSIVEGNICFANSGVGIRLWNSSGIIVRNNDSSNNWAAGIWLGGCTNTLIEKNVCLSNHHGNIMLIASSYNIVKENTCSNSVGDAAGIWVSDGSSENTIYRNNLINNVKNAYDDVGTNFWRSPEKMTYFYKGKTYTNYLGNYWSDYTGSDADGDGIGDAPYSIYGIELPAKDSYPLIEPFENYFLGENRPPNVPLNLAQLKSDGTEIPEGGTTTESLVIFKGTVSDPDGDDVRLEIELRRFEEQFSGESTPETISSFVPSGSEVTIPRYGLTTGVYKWRYRARDSRGAVSEWREFGTPGNEGGDFQVSSPKGLEVKIEAEAPEGYYVNKPLTLRVTVTNKTNQIGGSATARNVIVTIKEPQGGEIEFQNLQSTLGDLAPGQSKTAEFSGTMKKAGLNVEVWAYAEGDTDLGKIRGEGQVIITINGPQAPGPEWSFAIITDLHIGFGYPDYGPEGFDDKYGNGQEYYLTERLRKVVETINSDPSIKFVIVLGDLSDSAEYTEFLKAREILNHLNVPYIPVMGNHDAYPYTQATEPLSSAELLGAILPFLDGMDILDFANPTLWDVARDFFLYWWDPLIPLGIPVPGSPLHYQPDIREKELTALYAMGDRYFHEVFWGPENQQNVSRLEALFGLERQYHDPPEDPHQPMFHNYVFEYSGIRFIVLDCNERKLDASGAKLSPETEEWLKTKLVRDQPTILLAHQPLIMSQLPEPLGTQCFSEADLAKIRDIINQSGARILAAFGGHTHGNFYANPQYDQALDKEIPIFVPLLNKQKKISISIGAKSMLSCDVFITEAVAKETARWLEWFRQTFPDWYGRFPFSTRDGACVRIVRMRGDEIIEQRTIRVTEEQNLPPVAYFTNFPKGEKVPCLVHLTAFPYDPDGNPSNFKYSWDLGGGKAWSDPNEREVWVHFPGRGDYAVTLYVTDEGGAKASFTRIIPVRSLFEIILKSPADLVVIDPDGYTLTKDISEVPGMSYFQIDLFSNGSVEDLVAVWEKKPGNYVIKVIPEPDARPDDVYTLQILFGNEVITLANNVKISNIPEQYAIRVTETEIIPVGYVPLGKVVTHGPNPVPAEGCIFWLALPADTVSATLKIYAVDGALLVSIPLDPTADHYPPVGRWVPQDSNGRLLGTGLYLYLVEIHHADGRVTYSPLQKMVIKR